MSSRSPADTDPLVHALSSIPLIPSEQFLRQMRRYFELLRKWNAHIRLVGSTDEPALVEHVVDCAAVSLHLPPAARRLVDVGAGGGLPSVILASLRPEVQIVALEPTHKKCAFLAAVRREIPLNNLQPTAQRLEEYLAASDQRFDVAVSRATWPVAEWMTRAMPLVNPGGLILGMEGQPGELPPGAVRHPCATGRRQRAIISLRIPDVPAG